jgi:hypothetical protein
MMQRETTLSYGPVPERLGDEHLAEASWQITSGEFLLRGHGRHYFYYRRGEGIRIFRGPDAKPDEESLWLNGSVYAAIASMNGLLPIHASAVAVDGRVYAFTGPAGAGKSTLIAALGARGLPMFCDDTLVLDISDNQRIVGLPGHKKLKLTQDAVALTGLARGERVAEAIDKFYCAPPAGEVGVALPLAELIFLEEMAEIAVTALAGYERFTRINDDHYTATLYAGARDFRPAERFEHLSNLATNVPMARFSRPRHQTSFNKAVDVVHDYLLKRSGH